MFGLVSKSKFNLTVESYKHMIQDYKDQIAQLQRELKRPSGKIVNISSDGTYKNEIWKPIPGTNWKVSNYCRFIDSKGNISIQQKRMKDKKKFIVIPNKEGSAKKYLAGAEVAIMVYAFNPHSFKHEKGSHKKLVFRDGNPEHTHLSNIIF